MIAALKRLARRVARGVLFRSANRSLPLAGWTSHRQCIPGVDSLDDRSLERLNQLLPWNCFVVDAAGRRFGNVAWATKRTEPQEIPDQRILELDRRLPLAGRSVLEIGCFEGIHTIALCQRASRVIAVDSRIDNILKTIVRCALFDLHPTIRLCDIERVPANVGQLQADVCHHVGVLYHLRDPVAHLLDLGRYVGTGIMLDTHYALPEEATDRYRAGGDEWMYRRYGEYGERDPFSGMYDHAKWLRLDDIIALLRRAGFSSVEVVERRAERNGPRALIFAQRPPGKAS